ncbi:MAG: D-sedoheptulose-7-phosphate isomerase [bacterium]
MSLASDGFREVFMAELEDSIQVKRQVIAEQLAPLVEIVRLLLLAVREGNKIILFGNGGSAADSQHIAAELVSRFRRDREALPAIALTTDTSILTSVGNDYSFDEVFARQIAALGRRGDVAFALSTSGNSPNVLKAVKKAKEKGLATVGFTGQQGGHLKDSADICFRVPSQNTARIQEAHITAAHVMCEIIEREFSSKDSSPDALPGA